MEDEYCGIGLKRYLALQEIDVEYHRMYMEHLTGSKPSMQWAYMNYIDKGYAKRFRNKFVCNGEAFFTSEEIGKLERIIENRDHKELQKLLGDD